MIYKSNFGKNRKAVYKHKFEQCKKEAMEMYNVALLLSTELAPIHPITLGLVLNMSSFCYEIFRLEEPLGPIMEKEMFDAAIAKIDLVKEEDYKDTVYIMQLLTRGHYEIERSTMLQ